MINITFAFDPSKEFVILLISVEQLLPMITRFSNMSAHGSSIYIKKNFLCVSGCPWAHNLFTEFVMLTVLVYTQLARP